MSVKDFLKGVDSSNKQMEANLSIMFQSVRGTKQYWFLKVTGDALNIEYYFWWRDDCFGLLIHMMLRFTSWSVSVMNISISD